MKRQEGAHNSETCPVCRYELGSLAPSTCPECGATLVRVLTSPNNRILRPASPLILCVVLNCAMFLTICNVAWQSTKQNLEFRGIEAAALAQSSYANRLWIDFRFAANMDSPKPPLPPPAFAPPPPPGTLTVARLAFVDAGLPLLMSFAGCAACAIAFVVLWLHRGHPVSSRLQYQPDRFLRLAIFFQAVAAIGMF